MGLFNSIRLGSSAAGDYEVERSLRFNDGDSAYLNRTPSSSSNRRTFTISWWFKLGTLGTNRAFFGAYDNSTSGNDGYYFSCSLGTDDKFYFGAWSQSWRVTNRLFRDPSAWYHCVLAVDTTQSTADDRVKLYINGIQETSFSTTNNPSEDFDLGWNFNSQVHTIGRVNYTSGSGPYPFDGYMAEFNSIDGLQLTPSSFGKTDPLTGQWIPKKFGGSYGTNGFFLDFSDNSGTTSTTLGKDSSGNGNNFTPNNFSVSAGVGNDSLEDTPTNNFPTFNPIDTSSGTISNGNLDLTTATGSSTNYGNWAIPSSGKWFMESTMTDNGVHYSPFIVATNYLGLDDTTYTDSNLSYYINGQKLLNQTWTNYGATFGEDDVIGVAVDVDNNQVTFYKNGASQGAISFTFASGVDYFFAASDGSSYGSSSHSWNFGQRPFVHTVPTGFKKLCSANLPDPTIAEGDKHFDTLLYTGNETSGHNITGLEFQPDLVWIKQRSGTRQAQITDVVRGVGEILVPSETDIEQTISGVSAFNSDGFTLGDHVGANENNDTFVAWNWKGGGTASSNGNGSITSSVSVNASAGFSIVGYTGTGSNATVGHGLGVAPDCVILKRRSGDTGDWFVFHKDLGNTKNLRLNLNNSVFTTSNIWNNTDPTSSAVNIGTSSAVNGDGSTYVMYCFSEVAGYSKFGSYEGNQNADGPFVYLGFTPAFLLIKNADNGSNRNWCIIDATRTTFNKSASAEVLFANDNESESVANNNYGQFASKPAVDIVSNGFKVREGETSAYTQLNRSNTHIYLAFAESPFKYSRAR